MSRLSFELQSRSSDSPGGEAGTSARAARFTTLHGPVLTPAFMPVGTQATVRSQTPASLAEVAPPVLLANTYHLMLRPGLEVFRRMGGIHRFMRFDGPVLTDSGGFQIFSLPNARKITDHGAVFKEHVDGPTLELTPERSIEAQRAIGSDIMMVLDECIPSTSDHATTERSLKRTHAWAERSLEAREGSPQSLFGIVQGACFEDLRQRSAEFLTRMPFDGFAIGGLAVGETADERKRFTELTARLLPANLPRYLMGVGTPLDLLEAVHRGVDIFDCILPAALAQRGVTYTRKGILQLRRRVYQMSEAPLEEGCPCSTCARFSRSYLHHLVRTGEVLGWHLVGLHNLFFYQRLMREMRVAILAGRFLPLYAELQPLLDAEDPENPHQIAKPVARARRAAQASLGEYQLVRSPLGHWSVKHRTSGELFHGVREPTVESMSLYVEQSGVLESRQEDVVVWDVGMGAATNAMALIRALEARRAEGLTTPRVRVVSFERDLDPLRLSMRYSGRFEHLHHPGPAAILELGKWKSDFISWELLEGDFMETQEQAPDPDWVFYDPFSTHTNGSLWTEAAFERLARRPSNLELITYTSSTTARAALLSAGLWVARGVSAGTRPETTLAGKPQALRDRGRRLLGPEWLSRWERSTAPQKGDRERILKHPQFRTGRFPGSAESTVGAGP